MITKKENTNLPEQETVTDVDLNENSAEETMEEKNINDNMSDESFENNDIESLLSEQLTNYKDKYLRLSAEFDNYRKRTLKEKMELVENGGSDIIKSILTVLDDFDRAKTAMENTEDINAVKQGNELIYQKLIDTLFHRGLKEIKALNTPFDTDFCEAIVKIPVEDPEQKGKVVDVIEKGYLYKEKVLRFAKVVVGE